MGKSICRIGDLVVGECDGPGHASGRSFIGVWQTGQTNTLADGIPIVTIGDFGVTDCGHTFQAVTGSSVSVANGKPVHRVDDIVYVLEGGVGVSVTGSTTSESD